MKKGFEHSNQFNTDSSFTSIKFGYDRPILETELNELQEIQNHNRKLLVNKICKSGVIDLVDKDFTGEPIVYNPNNELNKIAIAPMKVIVNGYEIHVCGNYKVGEINTYLDIDLGDAPTGNEEETKFRQDLVFLQVWLEEFEGNDEMKRYGHDDGTVIPNTIVDERVGEETSHRMLLKWKIRTTNMINKYMDFDRWPYGFGFENNGAGNFIRIETDILDNLNINNDNYDKIFANATHYMFKGCMFYGDNNLWVAGRPDRTDPSNTKDTQYVYALPLFRVDRRNKKIFSVDNSNGSRPFEEQNINLRPDNKCYDLVYKSDIVDLRKTVIIGDNESQYHLDDTLNSLFTGQLFTKNNEKMKRIQFGIKPLNKTINNIIFLETFNRGVDGLSIPELGQKPIILPKDSTLEYKPSVTEFGANINGKYKLVYDMKTVPINKDEGTIDFFLSPNWNGFDNVEQNILTLNYQNVNDNIESPFLTIKKINSYDKLNNFIDSKLVIRRFVGTANTSHYSEMNVGINKISKGKIYHFRISWSVQHNEFNCYLNGKIIGNSLDKDILKANGLPIHKMIIGNVETTVKSNTGFIIDELAIYKTALLDTNWQIPQDYMDGNSSILPSFNGIFRNYRSNQYQQNDCVNYITTSANSTTIEIHAPYGTIIGHDTPKIYCLKKHFDSPNTVVDGTELTGSWIGLGTNKLIFNLNTTAILNFTKFSGETVAIKYSIITTGKNNIDDIPNEILRSELRNIDTDVVNEVSFNIENNTNEISNPREIKKLITKTVDAQGNINYEPVRNIYNVRDIAYDFSTFRNELNNDFAFARMLEFYVEGNNTNTYNIDKVLYGYNVSYIRKATIIISDTNGFEKEKEINITSVLFVDNKVRITISDVIMSGVKIKFEIGLCGITFDYNNNSKTYVGNMCKSHLLEFKAPGTSYEYVIPVNDILNGMCQHGIVKSIGKQFSYQIDEYGNVLSAKDPQYICYVDGVQQTYELLDGYNKPFIKIRIEQESEDGSANKVPFGAKIQIPILVTYQPTSSDILSVWYNYTPYQGVLDLTKRKVRRLSDWKYFITTLSSSNENDKYNNKHSLNNLVNRLPGGASASTHIIGQEINLKGHYLNDFAEINGYTVNKNLIFINQSYLGTKNNDIDKTFFDLKTVYTISKKFGSIQDDTINIDGIKYNVYLPKSESDNLTPINRYCGMACIVLNEFGDLYLLVIGDSYNDIPTLDNFISPTFGDLFIIPNRPGLPNKS